MSGNPLALIDPFGLAGYAQSWSASGAAIGGSVALGGSIAADAVTGGINVVATPAEVAGGAALGRFIGYGLGHFADNIYQSKEQRPPPSRNPFKGEPGTEVTCPTQDGGKKQTRRYGEDGYPDVDTDWDHDHGQGMPHVHEWGRPPSSKGNPESIPTTEDRGPGRPPQSGDPGIS